jgi:hypothetical protein
MKTNKYEEALDNDKSLDKVNNENNKGVYIRSGKVMFNDPLTSFLYDLMRDHLPTSTVEQLVRNALPPVDCHFTNGWLANYANDLAKRLQQK